MIRDAADRPEWWPRLEAHCDACGRYGRMAYYGVGGLARDEAERMIRACLVSGGWEIEDDTGRALCRPCSERR